MADDYEPERPEDDETPEGGPVKSFLEHLEDLRWVLVKTAVALALGMLLCLIAGNYVMAVLKWPLERAKTIHPGTNQVAAVYFGGKQITTVTLNPEEQQILDLGSNRYVAVQIIPVVSGTNHFLSWRRDTDPKAVESVQHLNIDLINLSPAGGFVVAFQVAIYGGIVLAAPFIFYFVVAFVFPTLKIHEKKYVYRGLTIGVGLFMVGVSFCYFILMPVALGASQMYSNWLGLGATQWKAEDYISFICKFLLGMGLGFELPVVILVLVKIGVLSHEALSKGRRYMVIICLILGAVLTTPEVITQVLMAVPLYGLYEVSVWISWYWEQSERTKKRARIWVGILAALLLVAIVLWVGYEYKLPWFDKLPWFQPKQ